MGTPSINRSHRLFAVTAILRHTDAIAAQIESVRSGKDIESIHRMRVATRRARNAMDLFESRLLPKRLKKWHKQIKGITQVLGAARDTDVQIQSVHHFLEMFDLESHKLYGPGIERLLLRLNQRRSDLQPTVIAAMDHLESRGVVQEMQETLRDIQAQDRATGEDAVSASLQHQARKTILRRIEGLMAYAPHIGVPGHLEELHQMRKAAKYLRYTLEVYNPLFNDSLKAEIKLIKQIQTILGKLHDDDVWCHDLPIFLKDEEQRFREFYGHTRGFSRIARGVRFILTGRQAHRETVHIQLADFWRQSKNTGQFDRLRSRFDASPIKADDHSIHCH